VPVLIVGASSDVGRTLARLLREEDAQVRAYVAEDDASLRAAGCHVAIGEWDDIGRIESAMEQVHTVVHLAPALTPPERRSIEWMIEETTDVAIRAAVSADVKRFLSVVHAGAELSSRNGFLIANGHAADMVERSGLEHVVLECAPVVDEHTVFGAHLIEAKRARVPVAPGDGSQRINPIAAADVAHALLLCDAREASVAGRFTLGGPDDVTYDEMIAMHTGAERISHKRSVPGLPRALAQVYARDCVVDSKAFLHAFPMTMTSLRDALASLIPKH
jgi:uncharacterized protein YbjT (DUF2867 family)